jgi:hypothetical protein
MRAPSRWLLTTAGAVLLGGSGCDRTPPHEIVLVDGPTTTRFSIESAYAEYLEQPGGRNELRLTLASYPVSCERWVAPENTQTAVTVVITVPAATKPAATTYAWTGLPSPDEPLAEPYALPKVQRSGVSRTMEPGGNVRLATVQLEPRGDVSGTLAFEFPGDAERPATRISGGFAAKMCRVTLALH